jgi:hypothetical protein
MKKNAAILVWLIVEGSFQKKGDANGPSIVDPEIEIERGDVITYNPAISKYATIEKRDGSTFKGPFYVCTKSVGPDSPHQDEPARVPVPVESLGTLICPLIAKASRLSLREERITDDETGFVSFRWVFDVSLRVAFRMKRSA